MGILSGLRVVDVTRGTAGPLLTQLLADMGPDMVRVESVDDNARKQQGYQVRLRGRRSVLADLARAAGQHVLERLVRRADVLVSEPALDGVNPVPWQWPELEAMNPRLVYCRITGYGDEGPEAGRPVHDHLIAARYGVYDQPGWREGPTYLTAPVPSLGAALLSLQAIGSALYVREKTGRGQEVTTSLLAGSLAFHPGFVRASIERPVPDLGLMARSPLGAAPFYSIYECGDGNWLHFGCLTQEFQQRAMKAIGLEEELKALGFGQGRQAPPETREQIIALIAARMKEKSFAEWAALFEEQDIPHAPSQWTEDLLDDPQVRHEGLVLTLDDPHAGPMEQMGPAIVFEGAPEGPPRPAPLPGQHTDEVLRELGFADSEIAAMRAAGAVA
ncbi:MAG TPA: CoA transferase [Dehalococcoidia bacterium]|nr:CoA transferase [Dehalococcoidia bacterium]